MAWSSESAGSDLRNERSTFARCVRSSERRAFSAFAISSCSWLVASSCIEGSRDELAPFHVEQGDFLPYAQLARQLTRGLGFPAHQRAIERPASPWGRPESF